MMPWLILAVVLVVGYLIYRFLVKPVLKVVLVVALALIVWLLLTNYL